MRVIIQAPRTGENDFTVKRPRDIDHMLATEMWEWPVRLVKNWMGHFVADSVDWTSSWKWMLVLPPRDRDRKLIPLSADANDASVAVSRKWTTMPVKQEHVRNYALYMGNSHLPVPFACRRLMIDAQCNTWPNYPPSLELLEILDVHIDSATLAYLARFPGDLRHLEMNVMEIDDEVWTHLFELLPSTLSVLKLKTDDGVELPDNFGDSSTPALVHALEKLVKLQELQHDFIRAADVPLVMGAAMTPTVAQSQQSKRRLRSLQIGVISGTLAGLDMNPSSRSQIMGLEELDVAIHDWDELFVDSEGFEDEVCRILSWFPAPSRMLRVDVPKCTNAIVKCVLDRLVSPTLTKLHVCNSGQFVVDVDPMLVRPLVLSSFNPHQLPLMLTSLSLSRCLPSRIVAGFTDESWTFPASLYRLDLSQNGLTTGDLKFLQPLLPLNLRVLNLARNRFHTLPTPFPLKLRVLDISFNLALSDDLDPAHWIEAIPLSLCKLIVFGCNLDDDVGRLLLAARRRAGKTRIGAPKLCINTSTAWAAGSGFRFSSANRFSTDVYNALVGDMD
ncbi:hypothetical protein GGF31_007216 [Allomyces arbusculus]|nr:hypothetical protein GGF31_007216 [Allomyces arbusculus]